MDESNLDVIIIGAGMAGLSAASTLNQKGMQTIVLESRNRIGGRVWTDRSSGLPVEFGAEFIHGDAVSTWEYIRSNDIHTVPFTKNRKIVYSDDEVVDADTVTYIDEFESLVEQYRESEQLSFGEFIDRSSFSDKEKEILRVKYGDYEATDVKKINLNLLAKNWREVNNGGNHQLPNGYDEVVGALSIGINIRLGVIVKEVRYSTKDGVEIVTNQGIYKAKYCISTLPLGVLKSGSVVFTPSLPDSNQRAIRDIGMGNITKVSVFFDSDVLGDTNIANIAHTVSCLWKSVGNKQVVTAFVGGSRGLELSDMSDQNATAEVVSVISKVVGKDISEHVERSEVVRWDLNDPYSGGAYSYSSVGMMGDEYRLLAESVDDVLFFAGEATSIDGNTAMVHGAIDSGIRTANEILNLSKT